MNVSRRVLFAAAILLLSTGCAENTSTTTPIPEKYNTVKEVTLVLEGHRVEPGNDPARPELHRLSVRLINPTASAIHFTGYSESQPWYSIQSWTDGRWVHHKVGWFCGTGLRDCRIRSGESSVIPVDATEKLFPLRVGVGYSIGDIDSEKQPMVWSERIEKDSLLGDKPAAKRPAE